MIGLFSKRCFGFCQEAIMNKKRKRFVICLVIISMAIGLIFGYVWYDFYDISGLKMYKDEPIRSIYFQYNDYTIIVTENGHGYMTGKEEGSNFRTYRNIEFHDNSYLHRAAAEFYDGKDGGIQRVFATRIQFHTLFVTDQNVLYLVTDFHEVYCLAKNINFAAYDGEKVYTVDTAGEIHAIDISDKSDPKDTLLWDGKAKALDIWNKRLFILTEEGAVCEWNSEDKTLSEPLFTDVQEFTVTDSSYYDKQRTYIKCAIMTIHKKDGSLYVSGTFMDRTSANELLVHSFEEQTLIGENISSFSTSRTGCVMLHADGTATYFGLRNDGSAQAGEADHITLPVQKAIAVDTDSANYVCVQTDTSFYMWSDDHVLFEPHSTVACPDRSIWSGQPYILVTP